VNWALSRLEFIMNASTNNSWFQATAAKHGTKFKDLHKTLALRPLTPAQTTSKKYPATDLCRSGLSNEIETLLKERKRHIQ